MVKGFRQRNLVIEKKKDVGYKVICLCEGQWKDVNHFLVMAVAPTLMALKALDLKLHKKVR